MINVDVNKNHLNSNSTFVPLVDAEVNRSSLGMTGLNHLGSCVDLILSNFASQDTSIVAKPHVTLLWNSGIK